MAYSIARYLGVNNILRTYTRQYLRPNQQGLKTSVSYFTQEIIAETKLTPRDDNVTGKTNRKYKEQKLLSIESSSNYNTLLSTLEKVRNFNEGVFLRGLEKLSMFVSQKNQPNDYKKKLTSDRRFVEVCRQLHNNMVKLSPSSVVTALKYLLQIYPHDSEIIQSLETQIIWLLPRMSVGILIDVVELHSLKETPLREEIFTTALEALSKRWSEISNPKNLISMMYLAEKNGNAELMSKLEEKALDLCPVMSQKDQYRITYMLAKRKHRNTPLLRALSYHLGKRDILLSDVHIMNLMYAFSIFKIYNHDVLDKISETVQSRLPDMLSSQENIVANLVTSFGLLRWRDPELLECFVEYFSRNISSVSPKSLSSLLLTLAKIQYQPRDGPTVLEPMFDRCSSLKDSDLSTWLNLVWGEVALGIYNTKHVDSVLDPQTISGLKDMKHDFQSSTLQIKVMNINCAMQCHLGKKCQCLSEDSLDISSLQVPGARGSEIKSSVITSLQNIAPIDKYMKPNQLVRCGCHIDAELVVNDNGEPRPLSEGHLPEYHRLVVRVYDFLDLTLKTTVPTGINSLTNKLLQYMGYHIVEIFPEDYNKCKTVIEKVKFLQEKITETVKTKSQDVKEH